MGSFFNWINKFVKAVFFSFIPDNGLIKSLLLKGRNMVYITYANYKRIMADPKSIKQHFAINAEGNGAAYIYDKKNIFK